MLCRKKYPSSLMNFHHSVTTWSCGGHLYCLSISTPTFHLPLALCVVRKHLCYMVCLSHLLCHQEHLLAGGKGLVLSFFTINKHYNHLSSVSVASFNPSVLRPEHQLSVPRRASLPGSRPGLATGAADCLPPGVLRPLGVWTL